MSDIANTIEEYLKRIHRGEDEDEVKLEYLTSFIDVPCQDILDAAHELHDKGYDETELRRLLCCNHEHEEHCECEECCDGECHCGEDECHCEDGHHHEGCSCGCHHHEDGEKEHRFIANYRLALDTFINSESKLKAAMFASMPSQVEEAILELSAYREHIDRKHMVIYPCFYDFGVSCFAYEEADQKVASALSKGDPKLICQALDDAYPLEEKMLGQLASLCSESTLDQLLEDW